VPIIAIKYWSQALRALGYETQTCVFGYYTIYERSDFDFHFEDFLPRGLLFEPLRPYAAFLWSLRLADVYLCFFDGGFLADTALRRLELPLLRLAGKSIIVSPYGRDIAVPGYLSVAEGPLLQDYPGIALTGRRVQARVDEFCRCADLIIRTLQYGYLPRWDVLWPTQIAIDSVTWRRLGRVGDLESRRTEVVVVHAPNHRHIKGTESVIAAISELRAEGLPVRLELLERRPNSEVLAAVRTADIIAEQFVAGYGLFAVEGMSAAVPVISALSWMPDDVRAELERLGCPIVDADRFTLRDELRALVGDSERRRILGEAGRRYTLEHHSYEAVGAVWDAIIRHVWSGETLPDEILYHIRG
jgi:glycosyltransferase involved in cell wall biosynthesis